MVYDFFVAYPFVVYAIFVWGYIFIFIRLKGIKRLWPASVLGGLIIFGANYWLISVGLYRFNTNFLMIYGIPFFHILWGAGNGIIFAYYYGDTLFKKVYPILGFSALVVLFESFVEKVKRVEHLGKFSDVHEYIFDVFILSFFVFLLTNIFKSRLGKKV